MRKDCLKDRPSVRLLIATFAPALVLAGCGAGGGGAWPTDQPPVALSNALMNTLVPGTIEAAGGYLIGAAPDRLNGEQRDRQLAREAVAGARDRPATTRDAEAAPTADLNDDGFVTTDELIALSRAGLTDMQLLQRLEATGQVFELSPGQQDYLLAFGVSRTVVARLPNLNSAAKHGLFVQRLQR